MTRPFLRLTLFIVLLLALATAAYRTALLERALAAEDARADRTGRSAHAALDALLDLRASQRAYVAEGQGVPYWRGRAKRALTELRTEIDVLQGALGTTSPAAPLDAGGEMLTRLARLEDRIGEHALAGRRSHAEDLIYADDLEASSSIERELRAAASTAHTDSRQRKSDLRNQELIILTLAGTVALLVALLLAPTPAVSAPKGDAAAAGDRTLHNDLPLNLRGTPSRASSAPATSPTVASAAPMAPPAAEADPAAPAALPSRAERYAVARVHAAADLCASLARAQHPNELSVLLAHISRVLDARGTIVWIAVAGTRTLTPALSYGYQDEALARMGSIDWDAENPAAEAFRRAEARVIDSSSDVASAIVVPLLSATGCVGVMTAELVVGPKTGAVTVDLARIFAAQLAGLIGPVAEATPVADAADATEPGKSSTSTAG